jgi:hypothetical protein
MKRLLWLLGLLLPLARVIAAPALPAGVVYQPTFITDDDSWTAGTGYVTKIGAEFVFLTAHHLFGTAGGLEKNLSPAEAKKIVTGMHADALDNGAQAFLSSEMLLISSARGFDAQGAAEDVAAFPLPGFQGPFLAIAKTAPQPGDTIYLLCRPRGEGHPRLVAATVRRAAANILEYSFEETGINFGGTSGAPLLNEAGELVGMNLGGRQAGEKMRGFGNPAASFVALVAEALNAKR